MGEKLLAQRVLQVLRNTYGQGSKVAAATLEWAAAATLMPWP